jgi:hypothetical protein
MGLGTHHRRGRLPGTLTHRQDGRRRLLAHGERACTPNRWLNSFFTPDCHFCQFQARLNAVMLNVVAKQLIANPAFEVL